VADKEYLAKVNAGIPMGYMGLAEDCAPAALYLCSEEAKYVTGSEIIVDGGMHL
jgi:NAD(P)-dependent dehydrogenase (short-subunit alcohol dehydrogenase family)